MRKDEASFVSEDDLSVYSSNSSTNEDDGIGLAAKESRMIGVLRIFMMFVLIVAGALLASSVYLLTARRDTDIWEMQMERVQMQVIDGSQQRLMQALELTAALADDLALAAAESSQSWPYVTIQGFDARGDRLLASTSALGVAMAPILSGNRQVEAWNKYSERSQGPSTDDHFETRLDWQLDVTAMVALSNVTDDKAVPLWQSTPVSSVIYNRDLGVASLEPVILDQQVVFGTLENETLFEWLGGTADNEPLLTVFYPIVGRERYASRTGGVLVIVLPWSVLLTNLLDHDSANVVVESSLGEVATYRVDGRSVDVVGDVDVEGAVNEPWMVESQWTDEIRSTMGVGGWEDATLSAKGVNYTLRVSPLATSVKFTYAAVYSSIVGLIFVFVTLLFVLYDCLVRRRQRQVLKSAVQSSRIVASLFPARVRDRLLQPTSSDTGDHGSENKDIVLDATEEISDSSDNQNKAGGVKEPPKRRLRNLLRDSSNAADAAGFDTKPIADFFPNCTVLFADIAGFTAWSSEREPTQVFTLLQNVYKAFDKAARKRGVFKVETIGDCYVAVTGLPDPQADHALIMASFALECRVRMTDVTRKLERALGPDTSDLSMRFGLHSGPVTAGVLRGERSRFQLFGDTVNTAARMESTGQRDFIQVSESTAVLLIEAGKGHWVKPREDSVAVKGKGLMKTYWLETREAFSQRTMTSSDSFKSAYTEDLTVLSSDSAEEIYRPPTMPSTSQAGAPPRGLLQQQNSMIWGDSEVFDTMPPTLRSCSSDSTSRLIDWTTGILVDLLKKVVAHRLMTNKSQRRQYNLRIDTSNSRAIDEVTEIIDMPSFDPTLVSEPVDPDEIVIDEEVVAQMRDYVSCIASMYRDNPFHNFEHASHVTMGMVKLLSRIVTPDDINYEGGSESVASDAHKYTYGITSDPLTQFAVVFCALIHDVDHTGVTNGQLVKEGAPVATHYNNQSVAEQNSIDLAWDLLMDDNFEELRDCIFGSEHDLLRFRQLVVNVVLATDIFDKELNALRKNRWAKAFDESVVESPVDHANRKATIVIEHLIQASDVSHTMQHWQIYRKWNERLFYEMYIAYQSGRTDTDPSVGWYQGELWFFDNYVIPLAKKLKDCGVFGVSSDECLNYALENRRMWADRGQEVVEEMLAEDYFLKVNMGRKSRRSKKRMKQKNSIYHDYQGNDNDNHDDNE